MTRRTLGFGIVALWLIALMLLYSRRTLRSPDQALAEAGMRVSPATYYYRLEQGAAQIGAASSAIDTTPTQLIATDFVRGAVTAGRDTFRIQARSQARFTRALSLQNFILKADGDLTPFLLRGVIQGEGKTKTLQLTTEIPKKHATTKEYEIAGLVFVPTVAPLPLMLGQPPKVGSTLPLGIFDPMSRSVRNVKLRVDKDSVFTVTDSASLDSATGRWVKAHEDTIHAWRVTGDVPTIVAWVDESGRMIAASEPGGISLMRTAFEIAFANWKIDNARPVPADTPIADSRTTRPPRKK